MTKSAEIIPFPRKPAPKTAEPVDWAAAMREGARREREKARAMAAVWEMIEGEAALLEAELLDLGGGGHRI